MTREEIAKVELDKAFKRWIKNSVAAKDLFKFLNDASKNSNILADGYLHINGKDMSKFDLDILNKINNEKNIFDSWNNVGN